MNWWVKHREVARLVPSLALVRSRQHRFKATLALYSVLYCTQLGTLRFG